MKTLRKFFHLTHLLQYTEEKRIFRRFCLLSYFHLNLTKSESSISNCNKCDICKNYLISDNKFQCKVTGRVYSVRSSLSCDTHNVVHIISCMIVEASMYVQLLILRLDLEPTKATSKPRKISVVLPEILTTNVGIESSHTSPSTVNRICAKRC